MASMAVGGTAALREARDHRGPRGPGPPRFETPAPSRDHNVASLRDRGIHATVWSSDDINVASIGPGASRATFWSAAWSPSDGRLDLPRAALPPPQHGGQVARRAG